MNIIFLYLELYNVRSKSCSSSIDPDESVESVSLHVWLGNYPANRSFYRTVSDHSHMAFTTVTHST